MLVRINEQFACYSKLHNNYPFSLSINYPVNGTSSGKRSSVAKRSLKSDTFVSAFQRNWKEYQVQYKAGWACSQGVNIKNLKYVTYYSKKYASSLLKKEKQTPCLPCINSFDGSFVSFLCPKDEPKSFYTTAWANLRTCHFVLWSLHDSPHLSPTVTSVVASASSIRLCKCALLHSSKAKIPAGPATQTFSIYPSMFFCKSQISRVSVSVPALTVEVMCDECAPSKVFSLSHCSICFPCSWIPSLFLE